MQKNEIEYVKTDNLKVYERNSRIHNQEQIIQIAKSIKEFGFTNPIIIDENNMILAGHARVEATKLIDRTYFPDVDEVPCIRLKELTEDKKRAYVIADNKIAENSEWNYDLYMSELKYLNDVDFDLTTIGIDADMSIEDAVYKPITDFSSAEVQNSDINKAQNNMAKDISNIQKDSSEAGVDVVCPNCQHQFKFTGY